MSKRLERLNDDVNDLESQISEINLVLNCGAKSNESHSALRAKTRYLERQLAKYKARRDDEQERIDLAIENEREEQAKRERQDRLNEKRRLAILEKRSKRRGWLW